MLALEPPTSRSRLHDRRSSGASRSPPSTARARRGQRRRGSGRGGRRATSQRAACASSRCACRTRSHSPLIEPMLDAFERALGERALRRAAHRASCPNLTGSLAGLRRHRPRRVLARPPARAGALRRRRCARWRRSASRTSSRSARTRCCSAWAPTCVRRTGAHGCRRCAASDDDWDVIAREPADAVRGGRRRRLGRLRSPAAPRRRVALPTYPFQRKRHWADWAGAAPSGADGSARALVGGWPRRSTGRPSAGRSTSTSASYPAQVGVPRARSRVAHAAAGAARARAVRARRRARTRCEDVLAAPRRLRQLPPPARSAGSQRLAAARPAARATATPSCASAAARPGSRRRCWAEAEALLRRQPAAARLRAPLRQRCCRPVLRGAREPARDAVPRRLVRPGRRPVPSARRRCATSTALAARGRRGFRRVRRRARPLRVLEIGAGTGGTTGGAAAVLAGRPHALPLHRRLATLFLDRARERFARCPFVDFARVRPRRATSTRRATRRAAST